MLFIKNRAGKTFIFFLALAILFAGCRPRGPQALLDGKELLERGRYAEAIERLKTATSLINTNADAWNYLGLAYHHAGQLTNAAQAYQIALSRNHDLTEAHYNLGCLWLEQNRLEAAKTELTAYTLRRENSVEGLLKLGAVQFRSRDLAGAEKSFKEALRLSPRNPEALNGIGLILVQRNRTSDAAQCFNDALTQQPDYSPALLNLAVVSHQYLNQRPLALQKYNQYLALAPRGSKWDEVNSTARALEQELAPPPRPIPTNAAPIAVRPPEPRITTSTVARAASVPKPESPTISVRATTPPPATNHVVEPVRLPAEPTVRTAQSVSPTSTAPNSNRTVDAATDRTVSSQRSNPPGPVHKENSATSGPAVNLAQLEQAVGSNTYPRYRYRSPTPPAAGNHSAAEPAYSRAVQAQNSGRYAEAIQNYQQAIQLDPAYYDAYYNLGIAATSVTNVSQALTAYEIALAIRADSLNARYNFALLLKQAGYVIDSVNELERLLVTYPDEPRAHLTLGNLYALLRQTARAREHYVKVLETDPRNPQAPNIREWLVANPR